jgi:fatty acid desaturase
MIMTTIAVAPLLDGTFSFANPSTQSTYRSRREKLAGHFYILQLIVGAGLILGIIGGISIYGSNPNKWDKARKELQAGTALFLLVWVAVVSIAITFWRDRKFMSGFQRSVYPALLAIALPCLLIRIIYSLANAVNIHTSGTQVFNPLTGSLAAYVCMSVIPEMAIVLTYEAVATYSILAKK